LRTFVEFPSGRQSIAHRLFLCEPLAKPGFGMKQHGFCF
jgi:hypothetical protein